MSRIARWSRSWSLLFAANILLFGLTTGAGWASANMRGEQLQAQPPAGVTGDRIHSDAAYILRANLRVAGGMLAGACTLGLFSLFGLLYNGFVLGYGVSALSRGSAETLPFLVSYAPMEFLAFILVVTAAQHLSLGVVRCLAAGEPLRIRVDIVALLAAGALLVVAAVVEASVMPAIAAITGQSTPAGGTP